MSKPNKHEEHFNDLLEIVKAIHEHFEDGAQSLSAGAYLFPDEGTIAAHLRAVLKDIKEKP